MYGDSLKPVSLTLAKGSASLLSPWLGSGTGVEADADASPGPSWSITSSETPASPTLGFLAVLGSSEYPAARFPSLKNVRMDVRKGGLVLTCGNARLYWENPLFQAPRRRIRQYLADVDTIAC